jgi:Zn-dependent protease
MGFSDANETGAGRIPVEVLDVNFQPIKEFPPERTRRPLPWLPVLLFVLTLLSTLAVGSEFASSYAQNAEPFNGEDNPFSIMLHPLTHPKLLLLGVPFSLTLLAILMAHEMGHFFACKYYGIEVSYPYFLPAPSLFGTFGAFIRIRSPITTRRALFDIGIAGPIAGFVLAVPAVAYAISVSKIVPNAQTDASMIFGNPPIMRAFIALFHPGVDPSTLLLSPVGRAAWFGLFATALNLIPAWQLDGGHLVYSLTADKHQRISILVSLVLIAMGIYYWHVWVFWGFAMLVLSLRFKHPPVFDRWQPLNAARKLWAIGALLIFAACFTLWPVIVSQ